MAPCLGGKQPCHCSFAIFWFKMITPNLQALQADAAPISSNYHAYPQDVLKAESFTDVLANVANDWMPQDPSNTWGGSFMVGGDWNFSTREQEQNGMSQGQNCLPDTSSNNSAEKVKGVQV